MKSVKKTICFLTVAAMLLGMSGCKHEKHLTHERMCEVAEELDIDDYRDYDDLLESISYYIGSGYYSDDGRDAQKMYDVVINRFNIYDSYDIEETTTIFYSDDDDNEICLIYLLTFESQDDAEDFFDDYADDMDIEEDNGYTYAISTGGTDSRSTAEAGYWEDNSVLVIKEIGDDTCFAEDFCESMNLVSPVD